jgi:hypothetical protein
MKVTALVDKDEVVFRIDYSHINSLLRFKVQDTNDATLWEVTMDHENIHKVTYGNVLVGVNKPFVQLQPADGSKPPDIRGKSVNVLVEYQFDNVVASMGRMQCALEIPSGEKN